MIADYHRAQAETLGGSMRQMSGEERDHLVVGGLHKLNSGGP
jgi:hypothetical protein